MKGIKILCVGKIKEKSFREGVDYYLGQIRRKCPIEIVECADEPTPEGASPAVEDNIRKKEGERLLQKISEEDYVIALCIDGKSFSSKKWRRRIAERLTEGSGWLVFVIGGSLGLSASVERRAQEKLSFSSMTFPHQMMRLILCEQIARI
ncbi:MAG: 23S rRNA (pseudouridine(1915)-N(3))-methyltransferase RlmH [Eubacteriales bacterium]|nr:23S rRNA (pseudouridine(1915)-N(3))-methyltransferase RlmH [Eubacteriales bacterium]